MRQRILLLELRRVVHSRLMLQQCWQGSEQLAIASNMEAGKPVVFVRMVLMDVLTAGHVKGESTAAIGAWEAICEAVDVPNMYAVRDFVAGPGWTRIATPRQGGWVVQRWCGALGLYEVSGGFWHVYGVRPEVLSY